MASRSYKVAHINAVAKLVIFANDQSIMLKFLKQRNTNSLGYQLWRFLIHFDLFYKLTLFAPLVFDQLLLQSKANCILSVIFFITIQVESIFLSAVDVFGHQFHPEILHKLITSETVVFDILSDFFYHSNPTVASVALEVSFFIRLQTFLWFLP